MVVLQPYDGLNLPHTRGIQLDISAHTPLELSGRDHDTAGWWHLEECEGLLLVGRPVACPCLDGQGGEARCLSCFVRKSAIVSPERHHPIESAQPLALSIGGLRRVADQAIPRVTASALTDGPQRLGEIVLIEIN